MAIQDILERKEILLKPNDMNNKEKAKEIAENSKQYFYHDEYECGLACALRMAKWKDEQFKIAYVITRSEEHCDYVEKVFFDKEKVEEYCKPFNEDEDSYHRDITKIKVSL